jgi:hypothetical protein
VTLSAEPEDDTQAREWAETMIDRIRMAYGQFAPSSVASPFPHFVLNTPADVPVDPVRWNLSEPVMARRVHILRLEPITAARQVVAEGGLDAVYHETVVPALQTGFVPVEMSANLPERRIGVLEMGAVLRVPARPPHRMHEIVESAELRPPEDRSRVVLRLSPAEPPEYVFTTYATLRGPAGIEQLESESTLHSGSHLRLNPDHFPVRFVPVAASAGLLAQASIEVTVSWAGDDAAVTQKFELTTTAPSAAVAVPRPVEDTTLEVLLRARADETRTLRYGPVSTSSLYLDLPLFDGYGPHTIDIECVFDQDVPVFAIDLIPEDRPDDNPANITFLFFTPSTNTKTWSWFARSPFFASYRYRVRDEAGTAHGAWVDIPSPFAPLRISATTEVRNEP